MLSSFFFINFLIVLVLEFILKIFDEIFEHNYNNDIKVVGQSHGSECTSNSAGNDTVFIQGSRQQLDNKLGISKHSLFESQLLQSFPIIPRNLKDSMSIRPC